MTRVNFYVLENDDAANYAQFVCRLSEKVCSRSDGVFIHSADETQTRQLDELLWSFREQSFLPHQLDNEGIDARTILIQHDATHEIPASHHKVLINLNPEIPSFFSQFERVVEIISGDEKEREKGRERYRFYRDRGYPLETHKVSL